MDSNMDLINDMFSTELSYEINVEPNKSKSYYIGQADHILNSLTDIDNYFIFLQTLLKNYEKLDKVQKTKIEELLNIKPKTIIKEKIVQKIVYKEKKPKLKNYDDY